MSAPSPTRTRKRPTGLAGLEGLWAHHHAEHRDPHQIVCQWKQAAEVDPVLLAHRVRGPWWDLLDETGLTLLVTREYEHLVMALSVFGGRPRISYLHLPHPNGLAIDPVRRLVHIASTRNPNMVYDFAPCSGQLAHEEAGETLGGQLLPVRARYLPGSLYLHDLAVIDGELYANAVGMNAIVRLGGQGSFTPAWWPACIDSSAGPRFERNYLQLNSIAAGSTLASSFFTASTALPSRRRPGHLNFIVDGRGVVFGGSARGVLCTGLTRPHSARLHRGGLWLDNSGYGELGQVSGEKFTAHVRLPGWTRGLCFGGGLAFVGTSRILPRYRHYAPGLDAQRCVTGVHAVDIASGRVLASLLWPAGNQIFAIEAIDRRLTSGFPFVIGSKRANQTIRLFAHGIVDSEAGFHPTRRNFA